MVTQGAVAGALFTLILLLLHPICFAADFSAPLITLSADGSLEGSTSYRISARVTDDGGIQEVNLHYRPIGSEDGFQTVAMVPDRGEGIYSAILPKDLIPLPGIEYYVEAMDRAANISQEPFPSRPRELLLAGPVAAAAAADSDSGSSARKWWLIGLGVLAVGALMAAGDEGEGDDEETGGATLTIEAQLP